MGKIALDAMIAALEESRPQRKFAPESVLGRMLVRAVERANRTIAEMVTSDEVMRGAATTLTAAVFGEERAYIAHVGDSRAYLIRDGEITRVTEDHTLIEELLRTGRMTEAEAAVSHFKHIITRVLGMKDVVDVDSAIVPLARGDRILLVSDGVWRNVEDAELARIVAEQTPHEAIARIVERTLAEGAPDNLTAVLATTR